MLATYLTIRSEIGEEVSRDFYDEIIRDARDFASLTAQDDYREFMVTHGYTEAKTADRVTEVEVEFFERNQVPRLRRLRAEKTDFEAWRKEMTDAGVETILEEKSLAGWVVSDLNGIDIIFALLGIATAYKIGGQMGRKKKMTPEAPPAEPADVPPAEAPDAPPPPTSGPPGDEAKSP